MDVDKTILLVIILTVLTFVVEVWARGGSGTG